FAEVMEGSLIGPESKDGLDSVQADLGNIRAALSYCIGSGSLEIGIRLAGALRTFWFRRGLMSEGARWLDRLVGTGSETPAPVRARALAALGSLLLWQGRADRGAEFLEESLAIYRIIDDQAGLADTLRHLGEAATRRGDAGRANACLSESLF